MAIQTINLGTYANDGTGDDLRVAFQKVNANILELASTVYGANVGENPPISGVEQGELWWSTVEGRLYVYYNSAWIDASPVDGFVTYDITAETVAGGASVRLNGTDLSQDSIKFASGANITVTRTDASTITLSSENFTGDVTGNLTGNVTGNLTGNTSGVHNGTVNGNVTGNLLGDTDGLHTGNVIGNVTGNLTGDTSGTHTGNVIGNVTGNIIGDTTGTHTGAVIGDVTGNTTGSHKGNVVDDGNIIRFDASTGQFKGNVIDNGNVIRFNAASGLFTGDVIGALTGNVTGNVTGNAGTVTNGIYTTSSINALADVDTTTAAPISGQSLVWDGGTSRWKPGTIIAGVSRIIAGANITINPTNGLGEVTITSIASGGGGGGSGIGSFDFGSFTSPATDISLDLGTF
jgi:trimeric autotransporter adhesin